MKNKPKTNKSKSNYLKKIAEDISSIRTSLALLVSSDTLMKSIEEQKPNQLQVTFPKMTLKQIFEESNGKTKKGNILLWNFKDHWSRSEPWFDKETTSGRKAIIDLEITNLGKNWNECDEIVNKSGKRMLNIAEMVYLCWKYEDQVRPLLENKWTWLSTKTVGACLGRAGYWDSSGPRVGGRYARHSVSDLGLGFVCTDL